MSVWYDKDDPRNNEPDREPDGFEMLCATCWGAGVIRYEDERWGRGFGVHVETARCHCQPIQAPREYDDRDFRQACADLVARSETYLKAHSPPEDEPTPPTDGLMSQLLAELMEKR